MSFFPPTFREKALLTEVLMMKMGFWSLNLGVMILVDSYFILYLFRIVFILYNGLLALVFKGEKQKNKPFSLERKYVR